jgi:hypothetical protein
MINLLSIIVMETKYPRACVVSVVIGASVIMKRKSYSVTMVMTGRLTWTCGPVADLL